MQLRAKTFWLPLNTTTNNGVVDAVSNQSVNIPTGNAIFFNCAAFNGDPKVAGNLDTISNVTSVTLSIYKGSANGTLLYQDTLAAAGFNNPACTYGAWDSQSDYQFGFSLAPDETNWSITGNQTSMPIWWAINAQTDQGPVLLGSGSGTAFLSGLSQTPSTVVNDPTYLTADQVAAAIAASSANFIPTITGVTGGGSTNLDGLNALARPLLQLIEFVIPGSGKQSYQVQTGTAPTAAPGIIRCADWNADTNPKLFVQV